MSPELALLFWSLVLFETKHFLCDFVLQMGYQKHNKGIYGHPAGFVHAGIHALGSLPAVLLLTLSPLLIVAIIAGEFIARYHVDWVKIALLRRRGLQYGDALYWAIFGAGQFLHQMSYVIVLAVLASAAAGAGAIIPVPAPG